MGLSIYAYSKLSPVRAVVADSDDDGWGEGLHRFYPNKDFPGREGSVSGEIMYRADSSERVFDRPYSRYTVWCEWLAKVAGYPAASEPAWSRPSELRHDAGCHEAGAGPFFELIWFSDREGVLGEAVCAKLAKDFADFDERAKAADDDDGINYKVYCSMRRGMEIAADGGCLHFC